MISSSRRQFLQQFIGLSGLSLCTSPLSLAAQSIGQQTSTDQLAFVHASGRGPQLAAPEVEQQFIALHEERPMTPWPAHSKEFQQAKHLLQRELAREGMRWRDDYQLAWSYQHYGVPDNSSHNKLLLHYCQQVQKYIEQQIELEPIAIAWHPLRPNDPSYGNRVNAAVGKYTYFVMRISVYDGKGNLLEPYLARAKVVERAVNHISVRDYKELDPHDSSIYLIRGQTALSSPFSETLHLSTHLAALKYEQQLLEKYTPVEARARARMSGETITESAAILLALRYVDNRAPRYTDYIVNMANSLSKQLPQFQQSVAYMQRYGIKNSLKVFQEDASAYLRKIAGMS